MAAARMPDKRNVRHVQVNIILYASRGTKELILFVTRINRDRENYVNLNNHFFKFCVIAIIPISA